MTKAELLTSISDLNNYISNMTVSIGNGIDPNAEIKASQVVLSNPVLQATSQVTVPWPGTEIVFDEKGNFTATRDAGGWICTQDLTSTKGFIDINFNISTPVATLRMLIIGKNSSDSTQEVYLLLEQFTEATNFTRRIDLNYYSIYQNLDLSYPFKIVVNTSDTDEMNFTCSKFEVLDVINQNDSGRKLDAYASEMDTKVAYLESTVNKVNNNGAVNATDGNRYYLDVKGGTVTAKNVLPSKILYFGNSLLGGWEGKFGMSATNNTKDYYAIVNNYITSKGATITSKEKVLGWQWEDAETESAATTFLNSNLKSKLNSNLDLVIIQLGDNVRAECLETFKTTCPALIDYIKTNAPNARIAWLGLWFATNEKKEIISNTCAKKGAVFIDICDVFYTKENQSSIGTVVTLTDGTKHTIENAGEANHPSDKGFEVIANRIINALF